MRASISVPLSMALALSATFTAAQPAQPAQPAHGAGSLAGWHGNFYIRDPEDWIRMYPKARIHLDFNGFFGSRVNDIEAGDGGGALRARAFMRRLELDISGEVLKRWAFNLGAEIGSQAVGNTNGKTEAAAGPAGADPTAEAARFAAVQTAGFATTLTDTWITYSAWPFLNFQLGQYQAPFSLENRTGNNVTPWMERILSIRGFVCSSPKEIGLTVWGETKNRVFNYEIGVFGGDGINRGQVDNRADFMGRIYVRPLATGGKGLLEKAQIGVSARHGDRDAKSVGYDYPAITTSHGWALWSPTYTDSLKRLVHILPSGAQNQIGGELRLPISRIALQGEAYYVANNTREAVDGYQLTNTERLGQIRGVGWYAQLSGWLGDAFVYGDPGVQRPTRLDLKKPVNRPKHGVELAAIVAGVNARYDGASRGGVADDPEAPDGDIITYEYGLSASYWFGRHARVTVNYILYHTPGSGQEDSTNTTKVPGNVASGDLRDDDADLLHELGMRLGASF